MVRTTARDMATVLLPARRSVLGRDRIPVAPTVDAADIAAAGRAVRLAGIIFVGTLVAGVAAPGQAQWSVERSPGNAVASAVGLAGRVHLVVDCRGSDQAVTLRLPGGGALGDGSVETQWDDGSMERYRFKVEDGTLSAVSTSSQIRSLIGKLGQRRSVRILALNARNEEVTDRFSLTGSSRAIGALPCSSAAQSSAGRPSGPSDAEIRRILVRQSISRYSGSCPCPYNTDRAGRRCGRRSAYSKPGGASPLCYPGDVSDRTVEAYRARTRR